MASVGGCGSMPGTRKYQRPASIAAGCTSRGKIPRRFGKCGYGRQGKTPTAGVHHRSRRTVRPGRTDTQTTPDTSRAADGTTRTFSGLVQTQWRTTRGQGHGDRSRLLSEGNGRGGRGWARDRYGLFGSRRNADGPASAEPDPPRAERRPAVATLFDQLESEELT